MEKAFKYLYITILSVLIAFALIVIVTSAGIFGSHVYVVRTGSMSPKIPAGSVIVDSKAKTYSKGDVITFVAPGTSAPTSSTNLVSHRIVDISKVGIVTYYQVKGDANNAPDPNLVPADNVVGKVQSSVPLLGYPVSFAKSMAGIIILIVIPATIIVYEELGKIKAEIIRIRSEVKTVEREVAKEEKKLKRWFIKMWPSKKKKVAPTKAKRRRPTKKQKSPA